MPNCPLCSAPVHYQGLVNIECGGPGCPNFKDIGFFGDVQIDWPWFNEFVAWFNSHTNELWIPEMLMADGRFQMRRIDEAGRGSAFCLMRFLPHITRKFIKEQLSQETFTSNGLANPYWVIFDT